jgi:hypothetical protein
MSIGKHVSIVNPCERSCRGYVYYIASIQFPPNKFPFFLYMRFLAIYE